MSSRKIKYNPAFLSDQELINSFAVHQPDLDLILQSIRENSTQSNQHWMLIGPRGIGKTMLALRTAAEVRRDKDLQNRWYPIVFGEESYEVSSPGRFWLEALLHLGQQTEDERWQRAYTNRARRPFARTGIGSTDGFRRHPEQAPSVSGRELAYGFGGANQQAGCLDSERRALE
jgi:hypothetical protein